MMRYVVLINLVIVFSFFAGAQEFSLPDSRSHGAGGCVAVGNGLESCFGNPAVPAKAENHFLSFNAANDFLLPEANSFSLSGTMALHSCSITCGFGYCGISCFNQSIASISIAKQLFKSLKAGVRLHYHNTYRGNTYDRIHNTGADIGLILKINDKSEWAVVVFNPYTMSLSGRRVVTEISGVVSGVLYRAGPNTVVIVEAEKYTLRPLNMKVALEWDFGARLTLRCGAQLATQIMSLGCSFNVGGVRITMGVSNALISGSHFSVGAFHEFMSK